MSAPFDGSTTYLVRSASLTDVTSSDAGTLSFWFNTSSDPAIIFQAANAGGSRVGVTLESSTGKIATALRNSSDTVLWASKTDTDYTDGSWHHTLVSWDLSATVAYIYVDGSNDQTDSTSPTSGTVDYEGASGWSIGNSPTGSGNYFSGTLYDLAFWPGYYLDPTDSDELRYVLSSDGVSSISPATSTLYSPATVPSGRKPVGYGHDGSFPTGTKPAVYFSGAWNKNRGTGGAFTLQGSWNDISSNDPDIPNAYRLASHGGRVGERWFDSEKSGMSAPRSETFIERRSGHPDYGKRLRTKDENDEETRDLGGSRRTFSRLLRPNEEDTQDNRR